MDNFILLEFLKTQEVHDMVLDDLFETYDFLKLIFIWTAQIKNLVKVETEALCQIIIDQVNQKHGE